ncbi:DUF4910 domain-containing protein [Paenibacillus oryzisoli]|uniref:DUF4910 domain-containing protein n=1 Tax=Paenibacillus oryzisoli TaxID=1850517 RepID=UPI003D290A33
MDRVDSLEKKSEKMLEFEEMDKLFDRLFPICRSITGPGVRETIAIFQQYIPLEQFAVPTGAQVFDWEIPREWRIREAWLKGPNGETIVDFKHHNLHVLNYSVPVNRTLSLDEVKEHLYSVPNLPDAIPYVTSYYKERWGFCLPHRELEKLEPGQYHAYIDSELVQGELNYAHIVLPGESDQEVLFSSYICHPSMANNELSGPIVTAFIYLRLANWQRRRFTYRFVLAPETIGAIAYLQRFGEEMRERIVAGMVLTCIGGNDPLSFKKTRRDNSQLDMIITHLIHHKKLDARLRGFTPTYGSDERQFCSPGFNFPVGQMSRGLHSGFPGYHNSLDTKEAMTIEALQQSLDELELVCKALELDGYYINQSPYGEVKLDKHGLYPDMNAPTMRGHSNNEVVDHRTQLNRILIVLNYCDGQHAMQQIADRCGCSILDLEPVIEILKEKQLIIGPFSEKRGL